MNTITIETTFVHPGIAARALADGEIGPDHAIAIAECLAHLPAALPRIRRLEAEAYLSIAAHAATPQEIRRLAGKLSQQLEAEGKLPGPDITEIVGHGDLYGGIDESDAPVFLGNAHSLEDAAKMFAYLEYRYFENPAGYREDPPERIHVPEGRPRPEDRGG